MTEIILGIALCVLMGRIASMDNQSGWAWGLITLGLCVGCFFIPLPFLRLGIAGVSSFVGMILYKIVTGK